MKNFHFTLCFILICGICSGQSKLSQSRTSTYYSYFYKLSPKQVESLLENDSTFINKLNHPVDSFLTDSGIKNKVSKLGLGNFLLIKASENRVYYQLYENHNVSVKIHKDEKGLSFTIYDSKGQLIKNALAFVENKKIDPNLNSGIYQKSSFKKDAILKIIYQNETNYFSLEDNFNKPYYYQRPFNHFFRSYWRYLKYSSPFRWVYNKIVYQFSGESTSNPGYIAFNKPIYKPGDTVKFKAFLLGKKNHKPVGNDELEIKIYENGKSKSLGKIKPYGKGSYESYFILNDSLNLRLDQNINFYLSNNKSWIFNRKISSSFRYEDYELKSTSFSLRTSAKEINPSDPLKIYFKAIDENNLAVPDGRVQLSITATSFSIYDEKETFIPDTILSKTIKLDPIGETKFELADTLLPHANLSLRINARFLNSNNESQTESKNINYHYKDNLIKTELKSDTLFLNATPKFPSTINKIQFLATNNDLGTIESGEISLPGFIIIKPNVNDYALSFDNYTQTFFMEDFKDDLVLNTYNLHDSAFFNVSNPRKLFFTYHVFLKNRSIKQGFGTELNFSAPFKKHNAYTCYINYLWDNKLMSQNQRAIRNEKLLQISTDQPTDVYPGKTSEVTIKVTDQKGKNIADADVTAFAVTAKFKNSQMPNIPYLGKPSKIRRLKTRNKFELNELDENGNIKLNRDYWEKKLGLDSITYFRFSNPRDTLQFLEKTKDGSTQIAPFVFKKGELEPVQFLYINESPVFSSQTQQENRYSFRVDTNSLSLRIRNIHSETLLKKIKVPQGYKLTLSINAEAFDEIGNIKSFAQPDTLLKSESNNLSKYFFKVVSNYNNRMAYLKQDEKLYLLNAFTHNYTNNSSKTEILTGPFKYDITRFHVLDNSLDMNFFAEGGYSFEFRKGFLKQKSLSDKYPFSTKLSFQNQSQYFRHFAIDTTEINQIWERYIDLKAYSQDWFTKYSFSVKSDKANLTLDIKTDSISRIRIIRNIILYNQDVLNDIKIFAGQTKRISNLIPGTYNLLVLLDKNQFQLFKNIQVKENGSTIFHFDLNSPQKNTLNENKIWNDIKSNILENFVQNNQSTERIQETLNEKYLNPSIFSNQITGRITDKNDEPLPGVSIKIVGTKYATNSDINGNFRLNVPANGLIEFNYIGFESTRENIYANKYYLVKLIESSKQLNEVVVVGYGVQKKMEMTGAVSSVNSMLQGRVAGVSITSRNFITIRGSSTINGNQKPLIIVDGLPYDKELADISADEILEINTLKDQNLTAIYGSRAANGVIIIITKKGSKQNATQTIEELASNADNIRKNFSDYAFWQPKLRTNKNGEAKFTVTFPDDITNWKTYYVGYGSKKLTGGIEGNIRSFKTLSANVSTPQFVLEGDQFNMIGKVMNYLPMEANVDRLFKIDDQVVSKTTFQVKNAQIDTFSVNTNPLKDSIKLEYTIRQTNGYFDGERREIPILKLGTKESIGIFKALNADTTLSLKFNPTYGKVKFNAVSSLLPIIENECLYLRNYEYLCNEQLASKLIGLLSEYNISKMQNRKFEYTKLIQKIIRQLEEGRNNNGAWGWWPNTNDEFWVSEHVIDALSKAADAGFVPNINFQPVTNKLIAQLDSKNYSDELLCLETLRKLKVDVDYPKYIKEIEKSIDGKFTIYDRLRLMKLKQDLGIKINLDSLIGTHKNTMLGNMYFGELNQKFFDNAIQNSILAYQILKKAGNFNNELQQLRNFFLEQRQSGNWKNTYESSLIIETILPDLLNKKEQIEPKLVLNNSESIIKFPFQKSFSPDSILAIKKTGALPIYVTAYQEFWNSSPEKKSIDFNISSYFQTKNGIIKNLKAGEETELIVKVTPRGDADYVMVEVPIPAGCSYTDKNQNWYGPEIHREYFKNKVSIFCKKLKQETYTFSIKLTPRYNGTYNLNPAKAEMMYFPTFYGREEMKKIIIN